MMKFDFQKKSKHFPEKIPKIFEILKIWKFWKFENFEISVFGKFWNFKFFKISNFSRKKNSENFRFFWKWDFVMKNYCFSSTFFSWKDIVIYFHFHTSRSVKNKVNWLKTVVPNYIHQLLNSRCLGSRLLFWWRSTQTDSAGALDGRPDAPGIQNAW